MSGSITEFLNRTQEVLVLIENGGNAAIPRDEMSRRIAALVSNQWKMDCDPSEIGDKLRALKRRAQTVGTESALIEKIESLTLATTQPALSAAIAPIFNLKIALEQFPVQQTLLPQLSNRDIVSLLLTEKSPRFREAAFSALQLRGMPIHLSLKSSAIDREKEPTIEQAIYFCIWNNLKNVNLIGFKVYLTDESIRQLSVNLPDLSKLVISSEVVTDTGLGYLRALRALTSLNLSQCYKITDDGVECLKTLTALTSLNLSCCRKTTDRSLEHLTALTGLNSLNLSSCGGGSIYFGLGYLSALTGLTCLDLSSCKIDWGIRQIQALPVLTSLNLSYCHEMPNLVLEYLMVFQTLTSLNLSYCYRITDTGLRYLRALTALTSLNLSFCDRITDRGCSILSAYTTLTNLNLSYCDRITNRGLRRLKPLTALTSLNTRWCSHNNDACRRSLLEAIPFLKHQY